VPSTISSHLKNLKHPEYDVEDTAVVTLDYGDKLAQINLTWAAGSRANSVWIAGTEGSISYAGGALAHSVNGSVQTIEMPNIADKQQYIGWYASLFKEFIRRVEGRLPSGDLLDEAATVMKLLELSYHSS